MTHQINPAPHGERRRRRRGGGAAAAVSRGGWRGTASRGWRSTGSPAAASPSSSGSAAAQPAARCEGRGGSFAAVSAGSPGGVGWSDRGAPRRSLPPAPPAGRGGHMAARRLRAAAPPRALPRGPAGPGGGGGGGGVGGGRAGSLAAPAVHATARGWASRRRRERGRPGLLCPGGGCGSSAAGSPGDTWRGGVCVCEVGAGFTPLRLGPCSPPPRRGAGGLPEGSGQGWGLRGAWAAPARPGCRRHSPRPPLRKILAPVALMSASPPSPFHLRCPRGLLAPQQTRRARWVRCDYLIFIFFFPKWCRSCMGLPFSGQL